MTGRLFRYLACFILIPTLTLAQHIPTSQTFRENEARAKAHTLEYLEQRSAKATDYADNYDVEHYDLNITFMANKPSFNGRLTMRARALENMVYLKFDYHRKGTIDSVFIGGVPAAFTRDLDIVTVEMPYPALAGQEITLTVVYTYKLPSDAVILKTVVNNEKSKSTKSIATHTEPFASPRWFPCKDDPSDKADSVDITINTDGDMTPVSNGALISDTPNPDGTHTVHWKTRYPIATYLMSVAICDYNTTSYTWEYDGKQMPVGSWYFTNSAAEQTNQDKAMLRGLTVFSDLFGIYPFIEEKYGMAEYVWGGAMEHQTVSSMGAFDASIIVHELAHQWFGDKVTCASFDHIWLNEGWATYCEALYYEALYGKSELHSSMQYNEFWGPGTIFVDSSRTKPKADIFNVSRTYNKASWVVHMLRGVVGDSAFFRATRNYIGELERNNYRSVTTEQFQQYYEAASGMDLDYFFNEWIYGEYYPSYYFGWTSKAEGAQHRVKLDVEQLDIDGRQLFSMPVQMHFEFPGRDTVITVWNDTRQATYEFMFPEAPTRVLFDPEHWILRRCDIKPQPLVNNDFKRTVLLVNGTNWSLYNYGEQLIAAYRDSVYTASWPFIFYDLYPYSLVSYPENIASAAGSVALTLDELKKFCTVVWVSNADGIDVEKWYNSPMLQYIKEGGNVVLFAPLAFQFFETDFLRFTGIKWTGSGYSFVGEMKAKKPGLIDMPLVDPMYAITLISPAIDSSFTEALFADEATYDSPVITGTWTKPHLVDNTMSGHFVLIGAQHYKLSGPELRYNMGVILDSIMCANNTGIPQEQDTEFTLAQSFPNPVSAGNGGSVTLDFSIAGARTANVRLQVFDQLGRLIAEPLLDVYEPGPHTAVLDVHSWKPGVYAYKFTLNGRTATGKIIVVE